jgi:hypothetical protein
MQEDVTVLANEDEPIFETSIERYFFETRTPVYSSLFVIPLFVSYELMAFVLMMFFHSPFRNGADILVRHIAALIGLDKLPILLFIILVLIAVIAGYYRNVYKITIRGYFFLFMLVESAILAIVLEALITNTSSLFIYAIRHFPLSAGGAGGPNLWEQLMLSLGAGLYEEFVFRLVCLGALLQVGTMLFQDPTHRFFSLKTFFALMFSSLIFSGFHYVQFYGGYNFDLESFIFRAIGGIYLSIIFLLRGFGISAWTHAFYDIFSVLELFG